MVSPRGHASRARVRFQPSDEGPSDDVEQSSPDADEPTEGDDG